MNYHVMYQDDRTSTPELVTVKCQECKRVLQVPRKENGLLNFAKMNVIVQGEFFALHRFLLNAPWPGAIKSNTEVKPIIEKK